MIVPFVPYCPVSSGRDGYEGRDLAWAYNDCFKRLGSTDTAILQDHDILHTTRYWYRLVERAVEANPDYGLISCMANRTACHWQKAGDPREGSIRFHMEHGQARAEKYSDQVEDVTGFVKDGTGLPAGYFFVIPWRAWQDAKGWDIAPSIRGVDWEVARRIAGAGYKIGVMPGVYVYHHCREVLGEPHP